MSKATVSSIVLAIAGCMPALAGIDNGTPVPEPATVLLVGAGLATVILWSRKRGAKK